MRFQEDALRHVISYVGPENYIFIAAVCRQWKRQYRLVHGSSKVTSFRAAESSLSTLLLYQRDSKDFTTSLEEKIGGKGDLKMVQWLYARNRLALSSWLMAGAALAGHLDIVKWLRANGCPWVHRTCNYAAKGGQLKILKWVTANGRANGCDWNSGTCREAARGGHLEVLKWARTNGCDWDEDTCPQAARGGHLEVLKWARTNGCDWDENTCFEAARRGHMEVLQWARDNGCSVPDDAV